MVIFTSLFFYSGGPRFSIIRIPQFKFSILLKCLAQTVDRSAENRRIFVLLVVLNVLRYRLRLGLTEIITSRLATLRHARCLRGASVGWCSSLTPAVLPHSHQARNGDPKRPLKTSEQMEWMLVWLCQMEKVFCITLLLPQRFMFIL